ncbi:MAG TPA: ATP-binding protein [Geobacteraceae bacterium]|nr:ATP-binding protein [Geobacteraceae bacterium]
MPLPVESMARPAMDRVWRAASRPEPGRPTCRRLFRSTLFLVLLILVPFIATAAPPTSSPTAGKSPAAKKILILNSYHPGYTWSDNELSGILDSFARSGIKIEPYVEYLDSKHFSDYRHFQRLKELFAVKYGETRPDLVMTLDNPAFDFAIWYRRDLFADIPVVFVGMNDYNPSMLKGETGITGIVERQDIVGTVKAALAIQPGVKEVVIVHDYTTSGLASRDEAQDQLAQLSGKVTFRYLPEMTIEEVAAELAKLKPESIVLPFSFSRDKAGKIFNHATLADILSKASPVPVYGTKVERLGYGIIGGSLLEGKSHGAMGAELAQRIIRGESADAIPVVTEPPSTLVFDNNQLKRFKIGLDRLPQGSTVINKPPGLYEQHGRVINIAGAIIAVLLFSLALVLVANRQRKVAEAALLESERKRARELEIANNEMESFCYAVSHDLQAPLRHINSFSRIIEEEYGDELNGNGRHYFSRIRAASTRMGQLIKDLLMLSQISRGETSRKDFDLGALAAEILDENRVDTAGGKLIVEIDKGMVVNADRQLLRVALDNLISNAVKYSAKTENPRIRIGMKTEGGRQVYYISDNGVGFDMQFADKLFAPFHRLHADSEFEGTGIGLATVQRVIHRHGGDVWAESEPGCGATFFFTLAP